MKPEDGVSVPGMCYMLYKEICCH